MKSYKQLSPDTGQAFGDVEEPKTKSKKQPVVNTPAPPIENPPIDEATHNLMPEKKIERVQPQIRVIEYDGKEARKKRSVDLNISEMLLPPLTKKSTATYKLVHGTWNPLIAERLQMDNKRIDPSTGQEVPPQNLSLPGSYVFRDHGEKDPTRKMKTMFNYGRENILENKEGDKYLKRELKDIEFQFDFFNVDCENNYLEYVFMELHPFNASNKWRVNKTVQPLFMRTDIHSNKSTAHKVMEADLAFEAERMVVEMTKRDQIIAMASSIPDIVVSGRLDYDNIKFSLRQWAKAHARDFFALTGDTTPAIKLNVLDAQGLGLLDFNPDKREYSDAETGEVFHVVMVHDDPLESFVKFLKKPTDESQAAYSRIKNMLDYWEW